MPVIKRFAVLLHDKEVEVDMDTMTSDHRITVIGDFGGGVTRRQVAMGELVVVEKDNEDVGNI